MMKLNWKYGISAIASVLIFPYIAKAQITPDNTLGSESSTINSINDLRTLIEGGAIRGENLFHSFEKFGVPKGMEVYFVNREVIKNIFSRITGNNISEIFGTLEVEGTANLFLINPNGIVFSENATIDVGGSFIATTAEKIQFEDGRNFAASDLKSEPILTWNAPIGLVLEEPGEIEVRGARNNILVELPSFKVITEERVSGIKVNRGQSISLIGGNVEFEGGGIIAEGGDIQLGSVSKDQTVNLQETNTGWKTTYEDVTQFQDIVLRNGTRIDASGDIAGNIAINGRMISLEYSSAILSNTYSDSSITSNSISIDASESLKLFGNLVPSKNSLSLIASDVLPDAMGNGIDINIKTGTLKLLDGAEIRAINLSDSRNTTGKININARHIEVMGVKPGIVESTDQDSVDLDGGFNSLITTGTGNAGLEKTRIGSASDIDIVTETLKVSDGGSIKADTFNLGKAGNLNISAKHIRLAGINKSFPSRGTGLFTSVSPVIEAGQNSGNINLITETLQVIDGARIKTSREGFENISKAGDINITAKNIDLLGFSKDNIAVVSGIFTSVGNSSTSNGGNINIATEGLNIINGARIQADSAGLGNGGNIEISARKIELNGTRPRKGLFVGGITSSTGRNSQNSGGNITIKGDRLVIRNGAQINAIAFGRGDGGNINITVEQFEAEGQDKFGFGRSSGLFTTSKSGRGGNINIEGGRLQLFDSEISASAEGEGNGGNVTIDTDTVLGINSDITATAIRGDGGNISITAAGLLGLEEREAKPNNGTSDVDASSEFGTDGTVTIINPQLNTRDPIFQFVRLETDFSDIRLSNKCDRSLIEKIVYTGRTDFEGDNLSSEENYLPIPDSVPSEDDDLVWQEGDPILDSNTIRADKKGKLYLVAELSTNNTADLLCE